MSKKFGKFLLRFLIFAALGYIVGVVLACFLDAEISSLASWKDKLLKAVTMDWSYIGAGVGAFLAILFSMFSKKTKKEKHDSKGKTSSGDEMDLSFDAKWLEPDAIKDQRGLIATTWSGLPSVKNTGIVFRSCMEGGKYHIAMKDEYHCLVIGTTGSGKTSIVFIPTIRIYAHSAEKPCMVISDPKGELYTQTSRILEDEGYRVIKFDLRDPFTSTRWNPMEHAYELYHKGKDCKNQVKKCTNGAKPENVGFKTIPGEKYGTEWFGFEGVAYPTEDSVRVAVQSAEQIYCDLAQSELKEICNTVAPKTKGSNDPTWEEGAQDFLYGCALAMLEDSMDPELGMTKDRFNFYNLYKIATFRDPDADAPFDTVRKYLLQGRDEATSVVPNLTSAVINNAPNTTKSYIGVLNGKISFMNDIGISYLTSESDINFDTFTDKPTVLYLVIPDDREERHNLAILCISQLYKRLVDKANTYHDKKLPKHVYYILDEFGNLPPIPKFDSMITVSRGRNILYEAVVQSYTQIETKYGADAAKTIIGNFNAQIYLGTDDQKTRDDFSKMCGDVQLIHEEQSTSKNDKDDKSGTTTNKSIQRTTRPLITSYELGQIPFGTMVVKLFRYNPMKLKGTRNDQVPFFYRKDAEPEIGAMKSLDTAKVYYDIKMRNKKILKSTSPFNF
ncbi:MAG: type IV secretory system conjugative DNA transfer family protein [Clostridia bacterium]|nr:type IV secretory system conjugative DNA transfer family protein [Clostridia bacterium]